MSVSLYDLRCEARLLATRIEAAEMTARHCRSVATLTPYGFVATEALDQAVRAERAALQMASRLSAIARSLPDC